MNELSKSGLITLMWVRAFTSMPVYLRPYMYADAHPVCMYTPHFCTLARYHFTTDSLCDRTTQSQKKN